jgi:hypothetical protein
VQILVFPGKQNVFTPGKRPAVVKKCRAAKIFFGFLRWQKIRHFCQKQRFSPWGIIQSIEARK